MHRFEFKEDDLFINRLKTYPLYNVFIYQGTSYVNKETRPSGSGGLVVFDSVRNQTGSYVITPKLRVNAERSGFKPVFKKNLHQPLIKTHGSDYQWTTAYQRRVSSDNPIYGSYPPVVNGRPTVSGDFISSSYDGESPITRRLTSAEAEISPDYYDISSGQVVTVNNLQLTSRTNITASALQNVAKKYATLSPHFIFDPSTAATGLIPSVGSRDLIHSGDVNFIFIPSMYYGSTIKKGSVELNYYITGSKVGTCADINHNGTLIGTSGSTSGSVVGLVMYDEGVIMLTSSVELESNDIEYIPGTPTSGSWLYFGTTMNDGTGSSDTLASASYEVAFRGVNYLNSMTMFAHASKGHLNHSNNPTYRDLEFDRNQITGSGITFAEGTSTIANIVSASYTSASFDKVTYLSKIHIYDEDGNLIAITSMASPVKKTLEDEFTFKMKLDL
jgi:hypothetical protein